MRQLKHVGGLALTVSLLVSIWTRDAAAATGRQMALDCAASLGRAARVETHTFTAPLWTWMRVDYFDETYPLGVDILGSNFEQPTKVVFLLHGGTSNFKSSFFTPMLGKNLAQFFRQKKYLVVGITMGEDAVPSGVAYDFMADWGLAKHRQDIATVARSIRAAAPLPYEVLGHSYGAAYALDWAAHDAGLDRLLILDIDGSNPATGADQVAKAQAAFQGYTALLAQGVYADATFAPMKTLTLMSILMPNADSGESRAAVGLEGNFTLAGLLYFSMIYTGSLPGIATPLTNLPGEYSLVQGYLAGQYQFAADPRDDSFSLDHSSFDVTRAATLELGSTLVPMALARDWASVTAYNGAYTIDFAAIRKPVVWLNTELGYGSQTYLAERIRQGGNSNVTVRIIPGYGHADVLYSSTADRDVWSLLVP